MGEGFVLSPGEGPVPPGTCGMPRFGASREETARRVSTFADVREGRRCGSAWYLWAEYEGLSVEFSGSTDGPHHGELCSVLLERVAGADREPAAVRVARGDLDLLGHEREEIERAGPTGAGEELTPWPPRCDKKYLTGVRLYSARHEVPQQR